MFKPYELAYLSTPNSSRRRIVQVISYPIPNEDKPETIMVRMVPNWPTTLEEVACDDLKTCVQYRYLHVARVSSTFAFPTDMLRYDDAFLFDHTIKADLVPRDQKHDVLVYTLRSYKKTPWTLGRWHSFSCSIKPALVRDLRKEQ